MKKDFCAVVLGGYVNGYSIISELHEKEVSDIILMDSSKRFSSYSNKIKRSITAGKKGGCLLRELKKLGEEYEKIVVFPTDDLDLENLYEIRDEVAGFCFLPFNRQKLPSQLNKFYQYSICEKLGVSCPKTVLIEKTGDVEKIKSIPFPVLIKPVKRDDQKKKIFRNLLIKNDKEFENNRPVLEEHIKNRITFIASEVIPGDGSNIYAYVCYRNEKAEILNEWTGKKLSQNPDDFGVFASASNQAPGIILELGRKLAEGIDAVGICEPEFKYDQRDKKYKLTEINMRSMMWHRVGNLSGVNIQYTQYLDATGKKAEKQVQNKKKDIHFVYLKHEIYNLFFRKNYYKIFHDNIFNSDKTYVGVFDLGDLMPFIMDQIDTIKILVGTCLKTLKTK